MKGITTLFVLSAISVVISFPISMDGPSYHEEVVVTSMQLQLNVL